MAFMGINVIMICCSCGIFGVALWLVAKMEQLNIFNLAFLSISIILFIITLCSAKLKRRPNMLWCYKWTMFVLFWVMLSLSMLMLFRGEIISDIAIASYDLTAQREVALDKYISDFKLAINNAAIYMLVFTFVIMASGLMGHYYRETMLNNTYKERKMMLLLKKLEKAQQEVEVETRQKVYSQFNLGVGGVTLGGPLIERKETLMMDAYDGLEK